MGFMVKALNTATGEGGGIGWLGALIGGGGRRMAIGGLAGGIVGGATTDSNSPSDMFRGVLGGAVAGTALGGLTTKTAMSAAWGARGAGWGGIKLGAKGGVGAATGILNNPGTSLAIGGLGVAGYTMGMSGPSTSQLNTDEMMTVASARQSFRSSTDGLVQGLHRGRNK